ncbi:hypothetical protein HHK36_015089 [Tetracentron sinense]|uniref:GDSL esterase/lipase 7 n=1 Tax=Tetracentron sinense TaxID=13715 RepID=A0A834Z1D8_TETSI|nr:hypothetical protein HHK36_015089 [Tetracentron sinense]
MKKNSLLLFCFSIFIHLFYAKSENPLAPALYVFGDSLFDSGNNNLLPTFAKADYLPYGVDFIDGVTGRFTNGKTVADIIAELLGLPFAPPYMGLRISETLTGFNYASGSCGILVETGSQFGKCLNLDEQIDMFQRTVEVDLPRQFQSSKQLSEYLSKSIFLISTGSNDYINNYLEPNLFDSNKHYSPQSFAQLLIDRLPHHFERLYKLGARKIIMFEIGPIGCIPTFTRELKPKGQCDEESNQLVSYFNDRLPAMLKRLTSNLQGATFVLAEANGLAYDVIRNPSSYGFTDTRNPCCIAGRNGTWPCIPGLPSCSNADKHFFWDAYHLTEAACSVVGNRCFNGSSLCFPINIQQLVQV